MIRKTTKTGLIINLDGPDGSAFALMAYAKRFARSFGYASDEIDTMITRMKSGNYKNLVKTFDEYFDGHVILETKNEELM